jgi:hypothetical protein
LKRNVVVVVVVAVVVVASVAAAAAAAAASAASAAVVVVVAAANGIRDAIRNVVAKLPLEGLRVDSVRHTSKIALEVLGPVGPIHRLLLFLVHGVRELERGPYEIAGEQWHL